MNYRLCKVSRRLKEGWNPQVQKLSRTEVIKNHFTCDYALPPSIPHSCNLQKLRQKREDLEPRAGQSKDMMAVYIRSIIWP